MDLKIGAVQTAAIHRYGEVRRQTQKVGETRGQADKLDISRSAGLFAEALAAAKEAPPVRDARVSEVRAAVDKGAYFVNSRLVAAKILEQAGGA
ncbi:MAG: flagellar biosynthesis anti-sigma factor FlgM [Oscillospiraceae bacterium]|jgi:flagellar biosynthesis anti-sigma factor FlgM|nr:flagellar biosynthesis anti-sigma factor FlgM [Oscillospiraceae bacterium]